METQKYKNGLGRRIFIAFVHSELEENKSRAMNDEDGMEMPWVLETEIGINSEFTTRMLEDDREAMKYWIKSNSLAV